MSEIVIRQPGKHGIIEAIRQIHAQVEANTLQVPHPSDHMWQERLATIVGIKQLVACIDGDVVAISPLTCNSAHAAVMLPILVSVSTRWKK